MAYMRFNVQEELRKLSRGQKTKADPCVLLSLIADDYLERCADAPGDSVAWLTRLHDLEDPRPQ
jgi:hypothetical protein